MPWIIKTLLCRHSYNYYGLVTGDMINTFNGKRYMYVCNKCARMRVLREKLDA